MFGSRLATAVVQPTIQAIAAGLLTGAITGGALVVAGVVPPPGPPTTALLACPGSGAVVANVPAGQSLLATARSEDGAWLEIYIGQPGIDGAWAPAAAVQLQGSIDGLPVADCAAPSSAEPTPQPLPSPVPSVAGTIAPTPEPTPTPSPTATPTPGATVSPTPKPTATPKPTPKPTPTPTMTFLPPPPTIPPPPPDNTKPVLTGLNTNPQCLDPSHTTSTIQVTATDNVAVLDVRITISAPGGQVIQQNMNRISGTAASGVWQYQVTASGWADGYAQYVVVARDTSLNSSDPAVNDDFSDNNRLQYTSSSCFIG